MSVKLHITLYYLIRMTINYNNIIMLRHCMTELLCLYTLYYISNNEVNERVNIEYLPISKLNRHS
jgi:hypothetical protein